MEFKRKTIKNHESATFFIYQAMSGGCKQKQMWFALTFKN